MSDETTRPLTAEQRQLIRLLAKSATKGEWHAPGMGEVHSDHEHGIYVNTVGGELDPVVADLATCENAAYIAAVPPETVLALLDALDAREAQTCEFCKFSLPNKSSSHPELLWCRNDGPAADCGYVPKTFGCNQWAAKEQP